MSKTRNWLAVHAHNRKAGVMKHRNSERGGSRNSSREYVDEYETYLQDIAEIEARLEVLVDDE